MTEDDVDGLINDLTAFATLVLPEYHVHGVSADPDDDTILECALAGGADYVVTGDRHLLDLGTFRGILIVPPAVFGALFELQDE